MFNLVNKRVVPLQSLPDVIADLDLHQCRENQHITFWKAFFSGLTSSRTLLHFNFLSGPFEGHYTDAK